MINVIRRHAVAYFALCSVAFTQPITDLYGRNLTVFSAAKLGAAGITVFVLLLAVTPALIFTAIDAIAERVGPRTHRNTHVAIVWLLTTLIVMLVARSITFDTDLLVYPMSALSATGLVRLYTQQPKVRQWVSWLSLVAVISLFTFTIEAWPVLAPHDIKNAQATIADTTTPVFLVVLDELPLYALLNSNGEVNADRFPGFARLATEGTWYRDAVAAANFTHQAVPAVLASDVAHKSSTPVLTEYPHNLFTLLGNVTTVDAIEPVTSLCPTSICASAKTDNGGVSFGRLKDFFGDTLTVFAQRALPQATRSNLPSTKYGWTGFGDVEEKFRDSGGVIEHLNAITAGATTLVSADAPQVSVVHALAPHGPWYMTPTQQITINYPVDGDNPDSFDGTRYTYQRMLYQLAATDSALVQALDTLDKAGMWDRAMVVVTADHGISFIPGEPQRESDLKDPDQVSDIYRVPLFIKYPNQSSGGASDCAAANVDVVPTISAVLGVKSEWKFEGVNLAGNSCPPRGARVIENESGHKYELSDDFESTLSRVDFYNAMVPADGDARQVAHVGKAADLVGTSIDLDALPSMSAAPIWRTFVHEILSDYTLERGAHSPALLTGGFIGDFAEGSEILVTVNGVGAGVRDVGGESGVFGFEVVLDYALFDTAGDHYEIELVLRDSAGKLWRIGPPSENP